MTWAALDPPSLRLGAWEEPDQPLRQAPPEALSGAPSSYDNVPRLGPPLPGDLGRPILGYRSGQEAASPDRHAAADQAEAAAEAERQRLAAAEQAARASGVLVQLSSGRNAVAGQPAGAAALGEKERNAPVPRDVAPAASQQLEAGIARAAADGSGPQLRRSPSPWTLSAGTIIPASLITGLNSDLPGTVIAQVTEPVFDTPTGRTVLIPRGARLIGTYGSKIAYGQRRASLIWQRIVFPDGSSVTLDDVPASDLAGYSGLEGEVDVHGWQLIKGVALSTLLGVGTELSLGGEGGELVRALRESTQQNVARAGDQITSRNLDVQPTLTVRPGWPLRAILHKDLVLEPWKG